MNHNEGKYLVFWTCSLLESSCSSWIKSWSSFWFNVIVPPISSSSSSSKVSSMTSSYSFMHSCLSLVGGDFKAWSLARRTTTSVPLVHALRAFRNLSKIILHFGFFAKPNFFWGWINLLQKKLVQPHLKIQKVGHSCGFPQRVWRCQLSKINNLPIKLCCGTISPSRPNFWNPPPNFFQWCQHNQPLNHRTL